MIQTISIIRITKILLLGTTALLHTLIALNNIVDYQTNYIFTQHVLGMDTTTGHALAWRAITAPPTQHVFYVVIISWEVAAAILCWFGTFKCIRAARGGFIQFNAAKNVGLCGLAVSLMLWLLAFLTVGGEWFVMWQSPTWNGQAAALRMFIVTMLTLIFFTQSERNYSE